MRLRTWMLCIPTPGHHLRLRPRRALSIKHNLLAFLPRGRPIRRGLRMLLAALTLPVFAARIAIRLLDDYPGGECLLIVLQTIVRDFSS